MGVVGTLAALLLTAAWFCAAQAQTLAQVTTAGAAVSTVLSITASSYPEALPNDGYSEATIRVELMAGGVPLAGQKVSANVIRGGGSVTYPEVTTDSSGVATLTYRAGLMPEPAEVQLLAADTGVQTLVKIPLAPVTYLDMLLLTPEEYAAHLKRQAAAAPIYKLAVSAFPEQLAADGGSLATITASLTHIDGKPAAGVPLMAEIISGEGDLEVEQTATDSTGQFQFYFIAGFRPGTVTVRVIEPSTGLIQAIDFLLVEAGPARVQLLYADPFKSGWQREGALLPADGLTQLPIIAEVTDLAGIPLAGIELRVEILDGGCGWVEVLDPVSDAQGQVQVLYHAGMNTGSVRLRAFVSAGLNAVTATGTMAPLGSH